MPKSGNKPGATRMEMTDERKEIFLKSLRENGGNITHAAATASPNSLSKTNPGYSSFRALMARDPEFSAQVQETLEAVKSDVYAEIYRRAMEGTKEAVIQKGEQATMATGEPAWITRYDNRLLLRLASKLDPSWSESRNINYSGEVQHKLVTAQDLENMSPEELQKVDEVLALLDGKKTEPMKTIEHKSELPVIDVVDEDDTLALLAEVEARENHG